MREQLVLGLSGKAFTITQKMVSAEQNEAWLAEAGTFEKGPWRRTCWRNWQVPFWRWFAATRPTLEVATEAARVYAYSFGEEEFESLWASWREATAEKSE